MSNKLVNKVYITYNDGYRFEGKNIYSVDDDIIDWHDFIKFKWTDYTVSFYPKKDIAVIDIELEVEDE